MYVWIVLLILFFYISKVTVENFDVEVNCLETGKFVVVEINTHDEEEAHVASVHKLVIAVLNEIAELAVSGVEKSVYIHGQLALLLLVVRHVPLIQPCLPNSVLYEKIMNHLCVCLFFFLFSLSLFFFCSLKSIFSAIEHFFFPPFFCNGKKNSQYFFSFASEIHNLN